MVATDRISAFDVVLPKGIPYKGQVLNQIASKFLDDTQDIVKNWKIASPDPMVTVGHRCESLPVEMIVRGYLTGSSWRTYKSGAREICGVPVPDGMREHERFAHPIITPTTKAEIGGHDQDISKEIYLIDEIHTPDSSRYFYSDGYEERFAKGEPQRQLSKEFVREWLMDNGFSGQSGQKVPEMTDEIVESISNRYIELYEHITGEEFKKAPYNDNVYERIETNVKNMLARLM